MKITVFLVDDHDVVRSSIASIIELFDDMIVIGQAGNGQEAILKIDNLNPKPDIILMDVNMPIMDGVEATKRIKSKHPNLRIIALSLLTESHYVNSILESGAEGYLLKSTSPKELYEIITRNTKKIESKQITQDDDTYINSTKSNDENISNKDINITNTVDDLSHKQKEILLFLTMDYSKSIIAKKLMLEIGTLDFMLSELCIKFSVTNEEYLKKIIKNDHIINLLKK